MRERLIIIWRKIQKSKSFEPVVWIVTWFIDTEIFNILIDFLERYTNRVKLQNKYYFFTKNRKRIKNNLKVLDDKKSRRVYINVIKYRCSLKRKYLLYTSPKEEKYFDSQLVRFTMNERVMDCGAFTGDTALLLEKKWPNWDNKNALLQICCWEPDEYNTMKLKKTLSDIAERHTNFSYDIVKKAAWKENTELLFNSGLDYASKITDDGNEKIQTTSIDEVAKNWGGKITFIKMDIEGAEPEALEGARETITHNHPTMAICIYHTDEQMIGLIEYIHRNYPFYKLYVRHYARAWTETVLYAVEKKEDKRESV